MCLIIHWATVFMYYTGDMPSEEIQFPFGGTEYLVIGLHVWPETRSGEPLCRSYDVSFSIDRQL